MNKLIPLAKYKEFMANFPICTVDIVLIDKKGRTLLFKRNNKPYQGEYFTLGGRLLKNESPRNCAVRKLEDEAGIKVESNNELKFIGTLNEINPDSIFPDVNYHSVNFFYRLEVDSQKIQLKLDRQHSGSKWFKITDPNLNKIVKFKLRACGEKND